MSKRLSVFLWIVSVVLMLGLASYQRMSGPTYAIYGKIDIASQTIRFKLPRTHGGTGDKAITLSVPDRSILGYMKFKRYKSYDEWTTVPMQRDRDTLHTCIPHQPPAGKVLYQIFLEKDGASFALSEQPVTIRFKGAVPLFFLIPHVILAFLAMCFSTRTALEALAKGDRVAALSFYTCMTLFLGGMILGPVVQKYAFGAFWTGWPYGHDLTDNKTAISTIIWFVAWWRQKKTNKAHVWIYFATLALFLIYIIPHSMLGSEIDYTQSAPNKK